MVSKHAPKNKGECIICGKKFQPTNGRSQTCSGECRKKRKYKYDKKYIKQHPEISREASKNWQQKNRAKVNAKARERWRNDKRLQIRNHTNELIRKKGINKYGECELCGVLGDREAHHVEYTKEDFILICKKCHQKIHYGH